MMLLLLCIFLPLPTNALWCYSGLKYVFGQEERQDTEECSSFLGLTDSYCYRFTEETAVQSVTKLGCTSVICEPIGNDCGTVEFAGVSGTLCCCDANNYCNSAGSISPSVFMTLSLFVPLLLVCTFFN
uniref:UPAR/Ly6 domain-containing protein n=2 Tax=Steinernema glaseri TaxID=37863 RepID=A0A1I8AUU8_9BILA